MQKVDEQNIRSLLKKVMDPEIEISIVDLGLVYSISINEENDVDINLILTSLACPLSETLVKDIEENLSTLEGIGKINVEIIPEPLWNEKMMSEEGKKKMELLKKDQILRFAIDLERTRLVRKGSLSKLEDGTLELKGPENRKYEVNQAGIDLWSSCDGTKTVNELIDIFSQRLKLDRIDMERELVSTMRQLLAIGLLMPETP
jgi:metal-sulfur cluster biosynthetic enzyme